MRSSVSLGSKADRRCIKPSICIYTIFSILPLLVGARNQSVGGVVLCSSLLSVSNRPALLKKHCSTSARTTWCFSRSFRSTSTEIFKFFKKIPLKSQHHIFVYTRPTFYWGGSHQVHRPISCHWPTNHRAECAEARRACWWTGEHSQHHPHPITPHCADKPCQAPVAIDGHSPMPGQTPRFKYPKATPQSTRCGPTRQSLPTRPRPALR